MPQNCTVRKVINYKVPIIGWRSALVLASHRCGPGSIPARDICELSLCCSLPCHEGFSPGSPVFRLRKNQHGDRGGSRGVNWVTFTPLF
jgi:hypothetical protein